MSRRNIYYWKCDRPAAFHGTADRAEADPHIEGMLRDGLRRHLSAPDLVLEPGPGQGNHLTWFATTGGQRLFIRVEDGPERDNHLAIESEILRQVRGRGVPVPEILAVDASRMETRFAWQAMECVPWPDLNHWFRLGQLAVAPVAFDIGAAVARWQALRFEGYGPPDGLVWEEDRRLAGCHASYDAFFHLRLADHLRFLVDRDFLDLSQSRDIESAVQEYQSLLQLQEGCLVHKDLALWNTLGSQDSVKAFIDFDDAVSGDPLDDLSLLACFHDAAFLGQAFAGYESVRRLPEEAMRRFWLHLLRNLLVKAVIRVGAGYFERGSGFFLIGAGSSGADLRRFTLERIALALQGLRSNAGLSLL